VYFAVEEAIWWVARLMRVPCVFSSAVNLAYYFLGVFKLKLFLQFGLTAYKLISLRSLYSPSIRVVTQNPGTFASAGIGSGA
jgi:hypothetical protein